MRRAIDLFCGAGGASLGIVNTGEYEVVGYDNWSLAVETHNVNGIPAHVLDLSVERPKRKDHRDLDLIWASPPCQPFSSALEQQGQFDPRDGFPWYLKTLKKFMPRLTVMENVPGLTYKRHAAYLAFIVKKIEALGYTVEYRILNCADYKVPQARRRLVLIGRLDGQPKFPKESKRKVSVFDALETDGSDNPPGVAVKYLRNPIFHQGYKGALLYCGRGRPLSLDEPSKTISASGGNHVHWFDTENVSYAYWEDLNRGGKPRYGDAVSGARRLTVDQMALLQSFPADFKFLGKPSVQVRQIGNAVPPPLVRKVIKANI